MVGFGCSLKYLADAPNSSGLSDPFPSRETSAWVCTSIATRSATFMTGFATCSGLLFLATAHAADLLPVRCRADRGDLPTRTA